MEDIRVPQEDGGTGALRDVDREPGFDDARDEAPTAVRPEAPLSPDDTMAHAARTVLATELGHLLETEHGSRTGADPEDLHQMRVATRRARTALGLFSAELDPGRARALRDALRPVAACLGQVRDFDVLLGGLDRYTERLPESEREDLVPLRLDWVARRDAARRRLLDELDSATYHTALAQLRALAAATRVEPGRDGATIRQAAPPQILRALERVESLRPETRHTKIRRLHTLRIAAKHLRYSLEFFRAVLGPSPNAITKPVVRLQDELGLLHDADVGAALAEELLHRDDPPLTRRQERAIRAFMKSRRRLVDRGRRRAPELWRETAGRAPRRRVLEALHTVQ